MMIENKLSPIVLFVYNRPENTRKTLQALSENYLASESELFIFADGAKPNASAQQLEKIRKTREVAKSQKWCGSVTVVESAENKGLARSVISGVSAIIEKYGKVIVLEDDLISSKSFLTYMNQALDFYKENGKIWSIAGFSSLLFSLRKYKHDVYAGFRGCSWGWATWKDRWEKVDWNVSDFGEFIQNDEKKDLFNRGGSDMTKLLSMQMRGECDSWAVRWCYQQFKEDMFTIYPVKSQIRNVGFDSDATHTKKAILDIFKTKIIEYTEPVKFEDCVPDGKIMKEFNRLYSPKLTDRILIVLARIVLSRLS